ncbi:hypothetical protein HB364_14020 [Pseudoflavitalea sp. X16]|uniref:hypothetical protein n=1 Tax=Paraflavitalea devenefica TaxID=2716334 RepID=UPI00141F56D1|nr:hypothetical protein [Paraflavitalea devenefica]NII26206.1 hypothetical protein [Paraflavitalea devenefica]
MRNTIVSALIALLASCRPWIKATTGIYHKANHKFGRTISDSIILWKENYGRYAIWRKKAIDYKDSTLKDTSFVRYGAGALKPHTSTIIEDSTNAKMRYNPRKRILYTREGKYKKIGG